MRRPPAILAATGPFFMLSLEETFAAVAEAGFDGVELMVTQDRDTQDPDCVLDLAKRYELSVPVVHGPFLVVTWRVFGTDPRGKIARSVELAQALQAETVVIHPPYRWQAEYAAWLLDRIHEVREETGITIAVENMFPVARRRRGRPITFHRGNDLDELRQFPYLTLDTSHLAVSGGDLLETYRSLADQVVHVHASNNAGAGRDSHAPLWDGVLPVDAFLKELGARSYPGHVTLELNVRPWLDDREELVSTLRANVELARACLDGTEGRPARPDPPPSARPRLR